MPDQMTMTGAHVVVYINGTAYARVASVSPQMSTPSREVRGIDCQEALELAPTISSVSCSMSVFRTLGDGGAEGPGMSVPPTLLPRGKYFSVMLLEQVTNTILFTANKCRIEEQKWDVAAKSFVRGSINFKALSWNNEVRPNT